MNDGVINGNEERFLENSETVKEIAQLFGLELIKFNPDWKFKAPNNEDGAFISLENVVIGYFVPDDFMGKLALLLGLKWVFERDDKKILERIDENKIKIKEEIEICERYRTEPLGLLAKRLADEYEDSVERLEGVLETRQRLIRLGDLLLEH